MVRHVKTKKRCLGSAFWLKKIGQTHFQVFKRHVMN